MNRKEISSFDQKMTPPENNYVALTTKTEPGQTGSNKRTTGKIPGKI